MGIEDFVWRGFAAGLGIAVVAGPLGCFIVWRRMAFFGDALAHSALLGIALGFLLGVALNLGIIATCLVLAAALAALQDRVRLASDTVLGIFAHSALSLGLVAIAFIDTIRVDLTAYLFGDILAVTPADLLWVYGGGAVALAMLAWLWRPMLSMTVHEDLARVEGVPVERMRLALTILLAIVVAIGMKIVGILLINSLLIIPAAAARRFARGPEQMAVIASGFGGLAVALGLAGSLAYDTPAGPSIVVAALLLFVVTALWPGRAPA